MKFKKSIKHSRTVKICLCVICCLCASLTFLAIVFSFTIDLQNCQFAKIICDGFAAYIAGIIVCITAVAVGDIVEKKYADGMKEHGFKNVIYDNMNEENEKKQQLFYTAGKGDCIDIICVSGHAFFEKFAHAINTALRRGADIRILISSLDSSFLSDIEDMECSTRDCDKDAYLRDRDKKIKDELLIIKQKLDISKSFGKGKLEYKFYNTQYRMPFILRKERRLCGYHVKSFVDLTLPPYKAQKHFVFECNSTIKNIYNDNQLTINGNEPFDVNKMLCVHFESVWNHAKDTDKCIETDKYRPDDICLAHEIMKKCPNCSCRSKFAKARSRARRRKHK